MQCGRFGSDPPFVAVLTKCSLAVLVVILPVWPFWPIQCGRFGCGRFGSQKSCGRFGCGRFGVWPFWPGSAFSDLLAHVKNNKTFVVEEVLFSSDSCNFTMFTVASLFPSHVRRLEWVAWRSPRASGLLQATGQCEVSGLDMLTNPGNPSRAWPDLWWHAWYIRINLQDVGDIDWYLQTTCRGQSDTVFRIRPVQVDHHLQPPSHSKHVNSGTVRIRIDSPQSSDWSITSRGECAR